MSKKDKIINSITAHPKITPKIVVFGIGLAITFAIGIVIGIGSETIGIFNVETAYAASQGFEEAGYYVPTCYWNYYGYYVCD